MEQKSFPDCKSAKLSVALEEYKATREELLSCNKNALSILNWGFSVAVALFSAGLASYAVFNFNTIRCVFFLLFVPICVVFIFSVWFGEVVRQQRVESFLCELEEKINSCFDSGKVLAWHHDWLRRKTENPLQGLQYSHYKNIALGFFLLIVFSQVLSVLTFFSICPETIYRLIFLFGPIGVLVLTLVHFQKNAMHYFQYDLFKFIFGIPWLSYLILFFRMGTFVFLGLGAGGFFFLDRFVAAYLIGVVVLTDILDGILVRSYASEHSRRFRIFDSTVDMFGLASLTAVMLIFKSIPFTVGIFILARQLVSFLAAATSLFRSRGESVVKVLLWNRLFYVWVAFVLAVYLLGFNFPEKIAIFGIVALSVASMAGYLADKKSEK